ncbi:MAG TPA: cupin domain-containing protein [Thermoanaerobaculia bacterium]|nr:cupin domain-containing protein [Thermoanaerobaculia bacterium]
MTNLTVPPSATKFTTVAKLNLAEAFKQFNGYFQPKIVGELNGQEVKLVKAKGEFAWHAHDQEDEMFLVVAGELMIQFRTGPVALRAGEMLVIPRGVEHRPVASEEAHVMLFEPAGTLNTGNVRNELTVDAPERMV